VSERAAFISAILDNPDDDTARLVFADWLEEHGEPERAEFIRCQIEAARLPKANQDTSEAHNRAIALGTAHGAEWRETAGVNDHEGQFERGFLTDLRYFSSEYLSRCDKLLTVEPASVVLYLVGQHEDGSPVTSEDIDDLLATDSHLRAVTRIASQGGFGAPRFLRLLSSPHLVNLCAISLFEDPIGLNGVRAIVESPSAFTLESLDLNESLQGYGGEETDDIFEAVQLIASAPRFASLNHLGLMFNSLNDRSIAALIESTTLPRTLRVELDDNNYDEERFADALAERFQPPA
jgi:uncharacterized protein (TIGR02996 family)